MSTLTKALPKLATFQKEQNDYVPHEVAQRVLVENCSAARSWREFLGKTTEEIANRIGISEAEYVQWEALPKLTRRSLRKKIAQALGIRHEQLRF
ncbi:MAG: helix-turn-helix domain-containing protein [Planctomycetaceae bacterium]|nr:helix-turn-helix domain-containing protein [Planctomycetaceae bacterium]